MTMMKKALSLALAGAALTTFAAPANAALTISFPIGATSGFFGDSSIATGAYDQTASFIVSPTGGQGTFSITATAAFFDIMSVFVDNKPFETVLDGTFDYRTLITQLSAGAHTLTVRGNSPVGAGATGSFGGQINFVPSAVPEPAAWALMIGGFGLVGGMMRRRVTKVTYATA